MALELFFSGPQGSDREPKRVQVVVCIAVAVYLLVGSCQAQDTQVHTNTCGIRMRCIHITHYVPSFDGWSDRTAQIDATDETCISFAAGCRQASRISAWRASFCSAVAWLGSVDFLMKGDLPSSRKKHARPLQNLNNYLRAGRIQKKKHPDPHANNTKEICLLGIRDPSILSCMQGSFPNWRASDRWKYPIRSS